MLGAERFKQRSNSHKKDNYMLPKFALLQLEECSMSLPPPYLLLLLLLLVLLLLLFLVVPLCFGHGDG